MEWVMVPFPLTSGVTIRDVKYPSFSTGIQPFKLELLLLVFLKSLRLADDFGMYEMKFTRCFRGSLL